MRKASVAGLVSFVVVLGVARGGARRGAVEHDELGLGEVELTAKTINVAVVADVDNPIAPNVLEGIVKGVQGWGKYVNANGGIAGRKVKVDFIDSKLKTRTPPATCSFKRARKDSARRHRHAPPDDAR